MRELSGKTAFVTGGASGIGLALGRAFAEAGMNVMLADVEPGALDQARKSLGHSHSMSAASPATLPIPTASSARRKPPIDGLRQCPCGLQQCRRRGRRRHRPYFDRQLALGGRRQSDGRAARHPLLPAAYPRHGEGGHIVNTASMAGMDSGLGFSPYAASKFAVVAMSEGLRMQLKPFGIGVSVLCPSFVRTGIGESGRNRPERYGPAQPLDPASPAGRHGRRNRQAVCEAGLDPADVAARVLSRDPRRRTLHFHPSEHARRGGRALRRDPGGAWTR